MKIAHAICLLKSTLDASRIKEKLCAFPERFPSLNAAPRRCHSPNYTGDITMLMVGKVSESSSNSHPFRSSDVAMDQPTWKELTLYYNNEPNEYYYHVSLYFMIFPILTGSVHTSLNHDSMKLLIISNIVESVLLSMIIHKFDQRKIKLSSTNQQLNDHDDEFLFAITRMIIECRGVCHVIQKQNDEHNSHIIEFQQKIEHTTQSCMIHTVKSDTTQEYMEMTYQFLCDHLNLNVHLESHRQGCEPSPMSRYTPRHDHGHGVLNVEIFKILDLEIAHSDMNIHHICIIPKQMMLEVIDHSSFKAIIH